MASLRASVLSRQTSAACSRSWLQLDQQFSLLRVSPAHVASKAVASRILAQTQTRPIQHHRRERPSKQVIPESLAGSDLAMDAYIEEFTGGSISEIAQSGADAATDVNAPANKGPGGMGSLMMGLGAPKIDGYARAVPGSPSYFTRLEGVTDSFLTLQSLYRRYSKLPEAPAEDIKLVNWKTFEQFQDKFTDRVRKPMYIKFMSMVKHLHRIHPKLKPAAVSEFIDDYTEPYVSKTKEIKSLSIDSFGRALGVGRRKESVARAWVVEGTGEVLINGKTLSNAFARVHDRESALWALRAVERTDKYNIWALVEGGGTTGQAEALTLAVAKGIVAHEPALKTPLRKGMFTQSNARGTYVPTLYFPPLCLCLSSLL